MDNFFHYTYLFNYPFFLMSANFLHASHFPYFSLFKFNPNVYKIAKNLKGWHNIAINQI